MKIFVSWSKEPARTIAVELKHALEMILGNADVWVSESDIEKGKRWGPQVAQALETTATGIICVTPNNVREPWLYFEAGALSKAVEESRVHPLCFCVEKRDLPGPLAQFQATVFEHDDFLKLVLAINQNQDAPLPESKIRERFARAWKQLGEAVTKALNGSDVAAQLNEELQRDADQKSEQTAISGDEVQLLRLLAEEGELTLRDLTLAIKSNVTRTRHYIDRLIELDLVQYIGSYIDEDQFALTAEGRELAVKNNWV